MPKSFFEPLIPTDIEKIVSHAAEQLGADLEDGVAKSIAEFTIEGRKAVNILADTYGLAVFQSGKKDQVRITKDHVRRVAQISRLVPYVTEKASNMPVVGKVFGLGVAGYLGSAIEIEAVAFPAREPGKGYYRFNDTAGSMAKDSMFNAAAVMRRVTGKELSDYDVNINFVGGGNIDGPSAGCAITTALISAVTGVPVRQDMALTGEISIQGQVKPVGGVFEKAYGACQAGMKGIIIPKENSHDIPERHLGLDIHYAADIDDVLKLMLVKQGGIIVWNSGCHRRMSKLNKLFSAPCSSATMPLSWPWNGCSLTTFIETCTASSLKAWSISIGKIKKSTSLL